MTETPKPKTRYEQSVERRRIGTTPWFRKPTTHEALEDLAAAMHDLCESLAKPVTMFAQEVARRLRPPEQR